MAEAVTEQDTGIYRVARVLATVFFHTLMPGKKYCFYVITNIFRTLLREKINMRTSIFIL